MPGSSAVSPPRCNAADGCGAAPVLQAQSPLCNDCQPVADDARERRDALLDEADAHARVMLDVEAAVRERGEQVKRGELSADQVAATDEEAGRYLVAHEAMSAALHAAHRLGQRIVNHDGPHTHPVFACAKHEHLLAGA